MDKKFTSVEGPVIALIGTGPKGGFRGGSGWVLKAVFGSEFGVLPHEYFRLLGL
jgi:hypothetical protein